MTLQGQMTWTVLLAFYLGSLHAIPVTILSQWQTGCQARFTVPTQLVQAWRAHLHFDKPVTYLNIWLAQVISHNDTDWLVEGLPVDSLLNSRHGVDIDFQYYYTGDRPDVALSLQGLNGAVVGTGGEVIGTGDKGGVSTLKYNYSEALRLSVLFYEAQRSGKLPMNNQIPWRGDSALSDRDNGHDLTGGWYDGDHLKYNLPMAFSTWVLEWGMLKFKDGYKAAGKLDIACDMIKWPLEYFLKCWIPEENTLYVQVGDYDKDRQFWGRAEYMNMTRPVYKVTPSCHGSDVGGAMVSALTAGYLVFRDICADKQFAESLLTAAKSMYTFAVNNRGLYIHCVNESARNYYSGSDNDELAVAASWMYRATGEAHYLNDAKNFHPAGQSRPWSFDWNIEDTAADLLLFEATRDDNYRREVKTMVDYYLPGGGASYTPCGLMWQYKIGPNRYAANIALIALMAAETGINPDTYRRWALSQINYLLGDNKLKISYEIGYGNVYPLHPHHSGSACPTNVNWCIKDASGPNPNLLQGALVGGPDELDNYTDRREDELQNSVSCDYNAGFQSALAGLLHLAQNNTLPSAPDSKCG